MKTLLTTLLIFACHLLSAQSLKKQFDAASERTAMETCGNEAQLFKEPNCYGKSWRKLIEENMKGEFDIDDLHISLYFNCDGQVGNVSLQHQSDKLYRDYYHEGYLRAYEKFTAIIDTLQCEELKHNGQDICMPKNIALRGGFSDGIVVR